MTDAVDAVTGRPASGLAVALPLVHALIAIGLAFAITAVLIIAAGKNPLVAYWALFTGAFGSWDRIAVGDRKSVV